MSELKNYYTLATEFDAARAADRATIAELQAKCERLQRAYEIARDGHDEISLEGAAMIERIEQLEVANKSLESDAARYRFLRVPNNAIVYARKRDAWGDAAHPVAGHVRYEIPEQLDAAIDVALAAADGAKGD